MDERFCLNMATIWSTPLDAQIKMACDAGFCQIGLWAKDVEGAISAGESLSKIRGMLGDSGLKVAELCYLGGWQDASESQLKPLLDVTRHLCELAQGLGCETIVAVPAMTPGWMQGAPARFRQICHVAAEYDLRVALEFPGIAAEVKDLRTAQELVVAAACSNGGLVIDTFHYFLGGSKLEDFNSVLPHQIFLVHISDAMNLPLEELRKPHDNRTFPGDGIIDFTPIWQQLNRLHYDGAISLEVWNHQLHQSDPTEIVMRACESLRRIENALTDFKRK